MLNRKDTWKNPALLFVLLHILGSVKVTMVCTCICTMYHLSKTFLSVHIIEIEHTTILKAIKLQFDLFNVYYITFIIC